MRYDYDGGGDYGEGFPTPPHRASLIGDARQGLYNFTAAHRISHRQVADFRTGIKTPPDAKYLALQ